MVGFELGADDYIVKPFSMRELMLRIQRYSQALRLAYFSVERRDTHHGRHHHRYRTSLCSEHGQGG